MKGVGHQNFPVWDPRVSSSEHKITNIMSILHTNIKAFCFEIWMLVSIAKQC